MIPQIWVYSLCCPRIRLANCMSFGMIVTRFPCSAQRLQSSKRPTKCASEASWRARIAEACQLYGRWVNPCWISRTSRAKGKRRINRSVLDWYARISRRALSPKVGFKVWMRDTNKIFVEFPTSKRYTLQGIKWRTWAHSSFSSADRCFFWHPRSAWWWSVARPANNGRRWCGNRLSSRPTLLEPHHYYYRLFTNAI